MVVCKSSDGNANLVLPFVNLSSVVGKDSFSETKEANAGKIPADLVETVRKACEDVGFLSIKIDSEINLSSIASGVTFEELKLLGYVEDPHGLQDLSLLLTIVRDKSRDFFRGRDSESIENQKQRKDKVLAGGNAYGYFPSQSEALGYEANVTNLPDLREAFSMGPDFDPPARLKSSKEVATDLLIKNETVTNFCFEKTPWPKSINDEFRISMQLLYDVFSHIGSKLLEVMSLGLGLDQHHFTKAASRGEHINSARSIFYPKLTSVARDGQARCGAHSDTGAVTLLWSDSPGLQLQHQKAGGGAEGVGSSGTGEEDGWFNAHTSQNSNDKSEYLIVNIGDVLQFVSKGKWRSTPHRVPAPSLDSPENVDRIVLVLFVMLAPDFMLNHSDGSNAISQGEYIYDHFTRWGRNSSDQNSGDQMNSKKD